MALTYAVGDTLYMPVVVLDKHDLGAVRCVASDGSFCTMADATIQTDAFAISKTTDSGANIKAKNTTLTAIAHPRMPSITWQMHKLSS